MVWWLLNFCCLFLKEETENNENWRRMNLWCIYILYIFRFKSTYYKKKKKSLWSLDSSFELKSFFYVFFHSAGYFDGLLACEMCLDSSLEDWILELIKEMHLHLHLNCLFLCIISCYLPISKGLPWLCDTSVE